MNTIAFNVKHKKIAFCVLQFLLLTASTILYAQRGYYDAPYLRYEADAGILSNGASITPKSYAQADLQSEASNQQCVNLSADNASIEWILTQEADGLVIRYSVPDGQTATVSIFNGNTQITTLTLTSTWSWEYLWNNGNPNNVGVVNQNPKMRFDEVRYKLPTPILAGETLKLVRATGSPNLDFIEMELVPETVMPPLGAVIYTGNGSTLQSFINANGGKKIFVPGGVYNVPSELYFGVSNTSLIGAGMWYTQINFTATSSNNGGLRANATNISFEDIYLTTNAASRSQSYKAINGVFTATSIIKNIWAEHFECGAWIAQYNIGGPAIANGFTLSHCRFRNNYADGINLCKGTSNAIVEHCNFRNNGDDDQAIWSANGLECTNNTFRYNTSENCWRASGLAIYGGKDNKAYNLIIRDNLESGIRISNSFPGVGFNTLGLHDIHDITITACGTFNDLYNQPVGAIDIFCANSAGTQVRNVQFYNIDIIDSKNDAIFIQKKSGDGIYNLSFLEINANGTGLEFPFNNTNASTAARGFFIKIANAPNGNGTYCTMNYSNRGGNTLFDQSLGGIGGFSWNANTTCTPLGITETNPETIGIYPNPANNQLVISALSPDEKISVFNLEGKLLLEKTANHPIEIIDVSHLKSGLYFITIKNGPIINYRKFIKQ